MFWSVGVGEGRACLFETVSEVWGNTYGQSPLSSCCPEAPTVEL